MAHVEEYALVRAPIQPVFDLIADHRRALTWLTGFTRFDWVGGPENGVGARVLTEGEYLGFVISAELEIVAFDPPWRLVSKSTGRIKSTTTWALQTVDEGTRVSFIGDYTLPLALRLVGDLAVEHMVGGQVRQSLVNLQALFAADAPST